MSHVIQVPQGYASRVLRSSLPLGILGIYAGSLGIWNVIVCASVERISVLFADSWVAGMVQSGYNLVVEEMDWVGHHGSRRNVLFCHAEGQALAELLLGDLKSQFEIMVLDRDITGVYAGFTSREFQISVLKDETLGFQVIVHPQVQRLLAVHKIDSEVFRLCKTKEHVLFTGLWWSPFGSSRLEIDHANVDAEDLELWHALKAEWGTAQLQEHLEPLISRCIEKRNVVGVPDGATGVRYLARSVVDSVSQYLKGFDAGSVFVPDMVEAMERWDSMREEGDEELKAQLTAALQNSSTAFAVCSGLITARRSGTAPQPSAEDKGDEAQEATPEAQKKPEPGAVAALAEVFEEDEDVSPYCAHLRMELQALAVKQHAMQMHDQKIEVLMRQKAHASKLYARAMKDFQMDDFNAAKDGFFECLKLGTLYLSGADPELSSAYYNAGRALHLAGILGPAKQILKTCMQLRTEQHRLGIVDNTVIDKTKQALQQCLQDCHKMMQQPGGAAASLPR